MHALDWVVVGAYLAASVGAAIVLARKHRGSSTGEEYMVAGRRLPWWIVGIADVATADGADAIWVYAFFGAGFIAYHRMFWLASIVAVPLGVIWARYWRRLALATPGQLYEERYGSRGAGHFRAALAVWGAFVNTAIVLAYVLKGFAQIMVPFLGWPVDVVLAVFCGATLLYTMLSGLLAVAYTDVAQFALMMAGRVVLAALAIAGAGGLTVVLARVAAARGDAFLLPLPPAVGPTYHGFQLDPLSVLALLASGFFGVAGTQSATVQKALAAKDERHAAWGQIFGAVLSLVVRLLPITFVALAAVAVFPASRTDTDMWADLVRRHAHPGLVGLLLVGVVAGYMSTLDGLVNFSASGLLNDVFRRHLRPRATERQQVTFGRAASVVVLLVAYLWARVLIGEIDERWINFINSVTGLFMMPLMLLRWTWWRLNLWGEVVGFVGSFPLAYLVWFGVGPWFPGLADRPFWQSFGVLFGAGWVLILAATLLTPPEPTEVLVRFYRRVRPPGLWGPIARAADAAAAAGGHETAAGARSARRSELRHDLAAAGAGMVFCGALVVGMGAAFGARWLLLATTAGLATGSAWAFVRLSSGAERQRAAARWSHDGDGPAP